jgi:hypothetical protein
VVDAGDDGAAAGVIVDQVKLPQGPRGIERSAREPAHQRLQFALAALARESHVRDVVFEIEVRIGVPVGRSGLRHRDVAKPLEAQEALLERSAQATEVDALAEGEHTADHHQVAGAIHPQPRGVDRGDLFATCHRNPGVGRSGRRAAVGVGPPGRLRQRLRAFSLSR